MPLEFTMVMIIIIVVATSRWAYTVVALRPALGWKA